MDEADCAQVMNDRYLNAGIAAVLDRAVTGESLGECQDCGIEIPEARRKAVLGCTRCVACQETFELNI